MSLFYINIDKTISEFDKIWSAINHTLQLKDTRRIGIVGEQRITPTKTNKASKDLLQLLTNLKDFNHPARLLFRFEDRHPTTEGIAPDIKKDDFINVIYDIYDSELDKDYPEDDHINVNVDVQRYYTPLLTSNINKEVAKLKLTFIRETESFFEKIRKLGFNIE